jgi:thymidylate kinase
MTTVALIGPDGAGKSSVIPLVQARLGRPSKRIYMGVNLESSRLMLPTTRLALEAKRRRGGRPDMVGATGRAAAHDDARATPATRPARRGVLREIRSGLRLANWIAEEWFRQGVAWMHQRRGAVVLFDRHFFCDYYANDIIGRRPGRPWTSRVHGLMLERLYPRPDLVILLDAPAEVLFARKGEGTLESLERMRQDYLALAPVVARFRSVDATQPVDVVVAEVIAAIEALLAEQAGESPAGASAVSDVSATPADAAASPAATRSDAA